MRLARLQTVTAAGLLWLIPFCAASSQELLPPLVGPRYLEPLPTTATQPSDNASQMESAEDGETAANQADDNQGEEDGDSQANGEDRSSRSSQRSRRRRPAFDPQQVEQGRAAFQDACTQCHDAERALSKRKSRTAWLATVRRMARMDGADIDSSDIVPIATYLASLSAPASESSDEETDEPSDDSGGDGEGADEDAEATDQAELDVAADEDLLLSSGPNISGTISTLWRGGNDNLENPDFFADVWLRLDWQPDGPIRGRVTSCTSCHSDQTGGGGFTLELVEATAHFDLLHWLKEKDKRPEQCKPKIDAEIKAGRFIVPFGAYSSMVHPGVYRTVTQPLMFNMGRQVNPNRTRPPVLPMPYSDEGVDLYTKFPVCHEWDATVEAYAVNGLQGAGPGVQFTPSRSYADNNSQPAFGSRATVGNGKVRFGGSLMSGQMQDDMDPELNYFLSGADATARFCDNDIRLYFEYAIRRNDSNFNRGQIAYGIVSEIEALLFAKPNLSALARYDTLEHRDSFGEGSIARFTWGLSTTLIGGSLFMVNHEHWNFPTGENDVDVLGVRWVATF